jgi:hypothetical protein
MSAAKTEKLREPMAKSRFVGSNKKSHPSRWLKFRILVLEKGLWTAGALACVE